MTRQSPNVEAEKPKKAFSKGCRAGEPTAIIELMTSLTR